MSPNITCPRCRRTSYHPEDVRSGYCGACHDWTRGVRRCEHDEVMDDDYVPGQIHAHIEFEAERAEVITYWWHVYRGQLQGGEGTVTMTLGPTRLGPDDPATNGLGKVRDQAFPLAIMDPTKPGKECHYVGSFQHEPDDDEASALADSVMGVDP